MPKDLSFVTAALYYLCGFAVPTFFLQSGYFLLNRGQVDISYAKRKCWGVIRVVVCWNAVIAILKVLKAFLARGSVMMDLLNFPLVCIKCLVQKGMLWHFWYLGALLVIYLMLPLLTRVAYKKKLLLVCTCGIAVTLEFVSYWLGYPVQKYIIQTFRLWTWLFYFMLGSEMNRMKQWISEHFSVGAHTIIFVIYTLLLLGFQLYVGTYLLTEGTKRLHAEYFYDSLFEVGWIILLFSMIQRISISEYVKRLISFSSSLTMGVYVIHPLVIRILTKIMHAESMPTAVAFWVLTLLGSAVSTWAINKSRLKKYLLL